MPTGYPTPVEDVLSTVKALFHHQGNDVLAGFLDHCTGKIIDDTDGSGYSNDPDSFYILVLEAPPAIFAAQERNIEQIEEAINEKLAAIRKGSGIHQLYKSRVAPQMRQAGRIAVPPEEKVDHIWTAGEIRLFISHLTEDKREIGEIKEALAYFGVSGFVAHADIKPTLAWEKEILLALSSMQALVAIITPKFHESTWTNQEIGVALGRGIEIISVKIDETGLPPI